MLFRNNAEWPPECRHFVHFLSLIFTNWAMRFIYCMAHCYQLPTAFLTRYRVMLAPAAVLEVSPRPGAVTHLLHHDGELAEVGAGALGVEVAELDRRAAVRVPLAVVGEGRVPPHTGPTHDLTSRAGVSI